MIWLRICWIYGQLSSLKDQLITQMKTDNSKFGLKSSVQHKEVYIKENLTKMDFKTAWVFSCDLKWLD
jgi:hypothetical protein